MVLFSVVSVCNALTFERLDLFNCVSVLVCRYIFRIFRSSLYVKVIGSRSLIGAKSMSVYSVCGCSAFDNQAILLEGKWILVVKKLKEDPERCRLMT